MISAWIFSWLASVAFFQPTPTGLGQVESSRIQVVDPKTYNSASGRYQLDVQPSSRSGAGDARYQVTKDGASLWQRTLPFTLAEAGITDEGFVFGYGIPDGLRAATEAAVVWILDPAGDVVVHHPFLGSSSSSSPQVQSCLGLIEWAAVGVIGVRTWVEEDRQGDERWHRWEIPSGRRLPVIRPRQALDAADGRSYRVLEVKGVPGTSCSVVHWLSIDHKGPDRSRRLGAHFQILDGAGSRVWSLDLPEDYTGHDGIQWNDVLGWVCRLGNIEVDSRPLHFEVLQYARKERVTFKVSLDEHKVPTNVRAVASTGFTLPWSMEHAIELRLPLVSRRKLEFPAQVGGVRVLAWSPIGDHEVELLCRESASSVSIQRLSMQGLRPVGRSLPLPGDEDLLWSTIGAGQYLGFPARLPLGAQAPVILVENDESDRWTARKIHRLVPFSEGVYVLSVRGDRWGWFAIQALAPEEEFGTTRLYVFDRAGELQWVYEGELEVQFDDFCLLDDGGVALLDGVDGKVIVFDRSGQAIKFIQFSSELDADTNYWCQLQPGEQGQLLVYGVSSTQGFLSLDLATGEVVQYFIGGSSAGLRLPIDHLLPIEGGWIVESDGSYLILDARGSISAALPAPFLRPSGGPVSDAGVLENGPVRVHG